MNAYAVLMHIPVDSIQMVMFAMWGVAFFSLLTLSIMWPIRRQPGGVEMLIILTGLLVWNTISALKLLVHGLTAQVFLTYLGYMSICLVIPHIFILGVIYSAREKRVPLLLRLSVLVVPLATLIVVFTNELHHWIWTGVTLNTYGIAVFQRNWWFWIWFSYAYLLLAATVVVLIGVIIRHRGFYRSQALILLLALVVPWLINVQFVLNLGKTFIPGIDYTPITLGLSLIIISLNYHVFHFMKSMPIAREQIMDSMNQAVLVLNDQLQILDANRALCEMVNLDRAAMLDQSLWDVLSHYRPQIAPMLRGTGDRHYEVYFENYGYRDIHISPMHQRQGAGTTWVVLIYNQNTRKQAQRQLLEAHEQLQRKALELEQAQNTIQSIGDLVPICAWCGKRIELEDGTWIDVERFIKEHSHAELTSGLCPECAAKHTTV